MKLLGFSVVLLAFGVAEAQNNVSIPEPTQNTDVPYRLFRTQNVYTLLKLDTRTGQIWQLQWGEKASVIPINSKTLGEGTAGRFTLYPTPNIYMFVLLDQQDGRQWQVQWGDKDHRFIEKIE